MSNVAPTIIPTQSGAGVGINTIVFNAADETVTATLSVGFSTINTFPFAVGDKVLVEGISVGVGSTGLGYNSSGYDYKLFDVTGVTEISVALEVLLTARTDYLKMEVFRNL